MQKLQKLMNETAKWSQDTFNNGKYHPSRTVSMAHHLKEEVLELIDSAEAFHDYKSEQNYNKLKMEFADCFLLLFNCASNEGLKIKDIYELISKKHNINKKRNWGEPNKNGVVKHIKN